MRTARTTLALALAAAAAAAPPALAGPPPDTTPPKGTPPVVTPPVKPPPTEEPPPKPPPTEKPPVEEPPVVVPPPVEPLPVAPPAVAPPPPAPVPAPSPPQVTQTPPGTTPPPRLRVTKTGPRTVWAGTRATFLIRVVNTGTGPAPEVRVTDVLPAGFSLVPRAGSPGALRAGRATWRLGPLAPGAARVVRVVVRADSGVRGGRCNLARATTPGAPLATAEACFRIRAVAPVRVPPVTG